MPIYTFWRNNLVLITNDATIAPWKIESDEEKFLTSLADRDENAKRSYVNYYREHDPNYYNKGLQMAEKTILLFRPDATEDEKEKYVIDMVYSLHRFGCMFDEYFLFNFEKLNTAGRDSFITDKNRWDYYNRLNTKDGRSIFNDKAKTFEMFKKYYHRDLIMLSDDREFDAFCAFRRKHCRFIVKPLFGSGGKGIYIEKNDTDDNQTVFERALSKGPVVIEELIQQVPEMSAIHPESLNTVRIPTLLTRNGVKIFHPYLRIGIGGAEVDNGACGGILALVDSETGIVMQRGVTESGKKYMKHPDTGSVIPGFQVPRCGEAVSLVHELAGVIPSNHYVGWDCALTEHGWVMVEGNPQGQFGSQYVSGEGYRYELERLFE